MSHIYLDDECNDCIHYVRFVTDIHEWCCEICHLVEVGMQDLENPKNDIIWGRYELRCGHQAHIRCFRRWCKSEGIGCPRCGPIEEVEENRVCHSCNEFHMCQ